MTGYIALATMLQRRYQNHRRRIEETVQHLFPNKSSIVWRDTSSVYYIIIRHVIRITNSPAGADMGSYRVHVDIIR